VRAAAPDCTPLHLLAGPSKAERGCIVKNAIAAFLAVLFRPRPQRPAALPPTRHAVRMRLGD
jgi:hypothetical protein